METEHLRFHELFKTGFEISDKNKIPNSINFEFKISNFKYNKNENKWTSEVSGSSTPSGICTMLNSMKDKFSQEDTTGTTVRYNAFMISSQFDYDMIGLIWNDQFAHEFHR